MAVRIRLARIGKKKAPYFRVVAVDKRDKRDGKYLENLGTYNPVTGEIIQFHLDKIKAWIDKGAIPSDTVKRITKQFVKGNTGPQAKTVKAKPAEKAVEEAPKKAEAKPVEKKEAAPKEAVADKKEEVAKKATQEKNEKPAEKKD